MRPSREICITVQTSDRFVVVFAPPVWAAGQTQEGGAHCRTPGGKHHLNDTGHDQRHPQDESGTLEGRRGEEVQLAVSQGVITWPVYEHFSGRQVTKCRNHKNRVLYNRLCP